MSTSGLLERNQIHKREDVLDIITRVDEKQTPFLARVSKGRTPHNTTLSWTTDKYADPKLGGVVDGTDVSTYENHAEKRKVLTTYLQTHRREVKVSPLAQEVSDVAGLANEMAEAQAKKLVELGRDIEATLLSDQEHQEDDGAQNAYLTRGLGLWILDTTNIAAQDGGFQVPTDYRPASGQIVNTATASITEENVQEILKAIYDQTGMNGSYIWVCGSTLRRRVTSMTRFAQYSDGNAAQFTRNFNYDGASGSVTNSVSVFEGDYGTLEVVSSNFIGDDATAPFAEDQGRGYILDMDKINLASHKNPTFHPLPDLGGGPRGYVEARCALRVLNPIGLGQFNTALS